MFKRIFVPCLIFLFSTDVFALNDTTKVLFLGNSFTYTHDVPGLFKGLAEKAGYPVKFAMHAPGGITVGDVSQGTQAHMYNPVVYNHIKSDDWDYVVLQDNQGRFVYGNGIFPSPTFSKVLEGHLMIRDSVKHYHPCSHVLWFAGWAFKNGYTGISGTGEGLINNIYENYAYLNDSADEIISPIGLAWVRFIDTLTQPDLWSSDEAHQSLAGSYLTACVLFSSIFRVDPEPVLYSAGLDTSVERLMRRIAYQTVTDSIAPTNLVEITPSLQVISNQLVAAAGYSLYEWYKDNLLIGSGSSNTFSTQGPGLYHVVATDQNSCQNRSLPVPQWPTTIQEVNFDNDFKIYPTPTSDRIYIQSISNDRANKSVTIVDMKGDAIYNGSFTGFAEISLDGHPAGIYFCRITSTGGVVLRKIIKL